MGANCAVHAGARRAAEALAKTKLDGKAVTAETAFLLVTEFGRTVEEIEHVVALRGLTLDRAGLDRLLAARK